MKHSPQSREGRNQTQKIPCCLCDILPLTPTCPSTHLQANINLLSATLVSIFCDFIWMKSYIILCFEGGSLASFTQYGGNLCWNLFLWLILMVHCFLLLKGKHFVIWICVFLPQVASLSTDFRCQIFVITDVWTNVGIQLNWWFYLSCIF